MNRGAFAAIINNKSEVLLVRSLTHEKFSHHWSLPGGLLEENETLKDCAIREAFEETGVNCEVGRLLAEVENLDDDITISIFKAKYIDGDLILQTEEISDAGWFSMNAACDLPLAFNTKEVLENL